MSQGRFDVKDRARRIIFSAEPAAEPAAVAENERSLGIWRKHRNLDVNVDVDVDVEADADVNVDVESPLSTSLLNKADEHCPIDRCKSFETTRSMDTYNCCCLKEAHSNGRWRARVWKA